MKRPYIVCFDKQEEFVFFANAKVASRAILEGPLAKRGMRAEASECLSFDHEDKFAFTVVRNPWHRCVSTFAFLKPEGTFEEFTYRLLREGTDFDMHVHLQTQGLPSMDYIARLETIEFEWPLISEMLNLDVMLRTKGRQRYGLWQKYITWKAYKNIAKVYEQDIDLLKYSFYEKP